MRRTGWIAGVVVCFGLSACTPTADPMAPAVQPVKTTMTVSAKDSNEEVPYQRSGMILAFGDANDGNLTLYKCTIVGHSRKMIWFRNKAVQNEVDGAMVVRLDLAQGNPVGEKPLGVVILQPTSPDQPLWPTFEGGQVTWPGGLWPRPVKAFRLPGDEAPTADVLEDGWYEVDSGFAGQVYSSIGQATRVENGGG